jgi:hypothetical protein
MTMVRIVARSIAGLQDFRIAESEGVKEGLQEG